MDPIAGSLFAPGVFRVNAHGAVTLQSGLHMEIEHVGHCVREPSGIATFVDLAVHWHSKVPRCAGRIIPLGSARDLAEAIKPLLSRYTRVEIGSTVHVDPAAFLQIARTEAETLSREAPLWPLTNCWFWAARLEALAAGRSPRALVLTWVADK